MNLPLAISLAALLALAPAVFAQKKERLYIANDDHTDYMWTADAATYAGVLTDMLDYYLALADATDKNPAPYQSRFNCDGSYWLWTYEQRKSAADFQRLIARMKDGHISAPMTALVSCYGGPPAEAVLRGMSYPGHLERKHGLHFTMALSMENQTKPLGLASLWAGAGARYSWKGICGCASKLPKTVFSERPHEIYWYTGLDGQRVLMKWYSLGLRVGTYLEAGWPINTLEGSSKGGPYAAIEYLDSDPGFLRRYRDSATSEPYIVSGAFGFGGDALAEKTGVPGDSGVPKEPGLNSNLPGWPKTEHFHEIARKESNEKRQVIALNELEFFEDFEKTQGATLPTESVTFGNEWDLYSASMSETSARVKRSVEKLRAAELMAALVSLQRPTFLHGREKERDQAYWEHDWTADGPVSRERRAAWQEMLATEIEYYVNPLHADGATRLGGLIPRPDEKAQRFFVHTEEVGAVIRVKKKADGGDYADTHARYDYATLNHFADITDGANTRGVTLPSPDLAFVRLGKSEPLALDTATAQLSVLAGGQVDGSWLGIHGQNGATHFLQRFALRPHAAYERTAAIKFALEHQNPFVTGAVIGKPGAPYPATTYSLLNISDPNVLLWALQPHDDGIEHGLVARVWNQSSTPSAVHFYHGHSSANGAASHASRDTAGITARERWRAGIDHPGAADGEFRAKVKPCRSVKSL